MFTGENFREIFDIENRKGHDLVSRFFPNLESHTTAIREKAADIRELRSRATGTEDADIQQKIKTLKGDLLTLKANKSDAVDAELEKVSNNVVKPGFRMKLHQGLGPKGKAVFYIDNSPEAYFVAKQLQKNLSKLYGVKQSNRHDLVCQLRDMVSNVFPFELVRTDISSFYESIDRKHLLLKLDQDPLLSPSSKKYIKQILDAYGKITQSATGIPRGVGISAYLAEIYARPIDRKIKSLPGVALYCRYVDDIAVVFSRPLENLTIASYQQAISDIFSEFGLQMNTNKTVSFNLSISSIIKFEYLGYRFKRHHNGRIDISPSAAKIRKYKTRLLCAFSQYERDSSANSRRAYRELVARVKFLTGNARLLNSKSSAAVGIYFSNSLATKITSLGALDKLRKRKIACIKRKSLRTRLKECKFVDGFNQRRFYNFSTRELQRIILAWKHG